MKLILRKMRQNLFWAVGYNTVAFPIAMGLFYPTFEEVYRTWRLYMAAARRGFEEGSLDVAQLLLARPAPMGPAQLPLRRWWHG